MTVRSAFVIGVLFLVAPVFAQSGPPCTDRVEVWSSNCYDTVLDTGWIKYVLRPNDAPRHVRDESCQLIEDQGRLCVSLASGFDGPARIFIENSIRYDGVVREDRSLGVSSVWLDLGDRRALKGKRLRVEANGHCMTTWLLDEYPVLDIHYSSHRGVWHANYRDWIMMLE